MTPRPPVPARRRTNRLARAAHHVATRLLPAALLLLTACSDADDPAADAPATADPARVDTAPTGDGPALLAPEAADTPEPPEPPAPRARERPTAAGAGPHFDIAPDGLGLDWVSLAGPTPAVGKAYLRDTIGAGLAVFDVDTDGDMDLFVPQGRDGTPAGGDGADRLYVHGADGRFVDEAAERGVAGRGYAFGALAFDVDADADEDLLVTHLGPNRLYRNDGGSFVDVTAEHDGVAGAAEAWSTGAAAGDPDGDGDLDVYLCNYVTQDLAALDAKGPCPYMGCKVPCGPNGLAPQADHYFRNDDGRLVEATAAAGFDVLEPSYGFQPTFVDVDDDGDSDLYVTNDSVFNALFVNDGAGHFGEVALLAGAATGRMGQMEAGMGLATGHATDDALPELYVTNFSNQSNSYYANLTAAPDDPWFEETGEQEGCGRATWFRLAWGTSFADFDADGWLDLFAANGHIYHQLEGCAPERIVYRQENDLFRGGPGGYDDWATRAGPAFASAASHRGSVTVDLDDDGDLDLVVQRLDEAPLVALNTSPEPGHHLVLDVRRRLVPDGPAVLAVGARVTLTAGDRSWTRDLLRGSSFLCSEDPRLVFGLGAVTAVDHLRVALPGREPVELDTALVADRTWRLVLEADGSLTVDPEPTR